MQEAAGSADQTDRTEETTAGKEETDTGTEPVEMDADFEKLYQNIRLFLQKEGAENGKFSLQV